MMDPVRGIGPDTRPSDAAIVGILWAFWLVIAFVGAVVAAHLMVDSDPLVRALVVLVVEAGLLMAVVVSRPETGAHLFRGSVRAKHWRLLAIPFAVAVLPIVAGVDTSDTGPWWLILVGYGLTGIVEEGFFRGVMIRLLARRSAAAMVVSTSILFGLAHLGNLLLRDNPAIVVAQAFGAFCFGVGMAAIRLRLPSVWPLMAIHFLQDLVLHVGALPVIPVNVAQDTILLILGLVLLRRSEHRARVPEPVHVG